MYRKRIIERFKEIWGEDNFLQVATFGTLGPKAVLKRACKGLDIDDDVAEKMSTLVPTDRGVVRPLSVCLDPAHPMRIQELITEVVKHPGLKEILLRLEGVIISMGSHAGGICPYTEPYVEQLAAVRSPRGVMQTCFDLHDAEATGTTKFDNLTTTATELIRKEIELLVRDGYIEWAGNLRDTYESVIGVDNLEYEDSQMWEKVLDVPQMFQFETPIGINILKKIQPKKIEELCAASSLMRLLPQGMSEVPADRYLRYREDVENFRRDARNCGLNAEEIQVIEDVCAPDGYMTLHQETLMLLSMHPKVAGFTYKEANKLRKSVAKKDPQAQQEVKDMFYEWCENAGTRQVFASYVWNEMFAAQMGYSFSVPHVLAYGLVALQELNLFHRFPKEYWYASILDTEGIASDESSGGGTDYSKITKAIYLLRNANVNVDAPLINNADNEFGIDVENHKILYALSAIPLINDDDVEVIKAQRPYRNLQDFVDRSNFNKSKVINLIKAGSFGDPVKRMKTYAGILALKNMPSKFGITQAKKYMNALRDETMAGNMQLITMLKDPANMLGTQGSKKVYLLPPEYIGLCADLKYEQDWWDDGDQTCITNTGIDKAMKKEMTEIKEFVKTEEFITNYWECMRDDIYNELVGDKPDPIRWEFDATSYYHTHNIFSQELLDEQEWFNFDEMPEDPVYEVKEGRRGTWHEYALYSMPITVIGKNDIRHNIMGLTADNKVVSIRMQDGEYAHYKKSTKAEKSWFTRGNLLLLHGYRQGDEFKLKKYTSSPFNHTIYKINDLDGMSVELQSERLADE